MSASFISHANTYQGDYHIIKRTPGREFTNSLHYHDFYEAQFYFCKDQDVCIGNVQLGDESYQLKNGDVLLINIFVPHLIAMEEETEYERYCISISPSLMSFMSAEHSDFYNIYSTTNSNYPLVHMDETLQADFLDMYRHYENRLPLRKHSQRYLEQSLLFNCVALLYDLYYSDEPVASADVMHRSVLTTLVRYIDAHIAEDLSLEQLAKVANFSTYHLCRIFKKNTGTTLNKYINSKRIENAKFLMADSTSIQDISKVVGFNNYNQFYRTFCQIVGISPAEYRKLLSVQGDTSISTAFLESVEKINPI